MLSGYSAFSLLFCRNGKLNAFSKKINAIYWYDITQEDQTLPFFDRKPSEKSLFYWNETLKKLKRINLANRTPHSTEAYSMVTVTLI